MGHTAETPAKRRGTAWPADDRDTLRTRRRDPQSMERQQRATGAELMKGSDDEVNANTQAPLCWGIHDRYWPSRKTRAAPTRFGATWS